MKARRCVRSSTLSYAGGQGEKKKIRAARRPFGLRIIRADMDQSGQPTTRLATRVRNIGHPLRPPKLSPVASPDQNTHHADVTWDRFAMTRCRNRADIFVVLSPLEGET